MSSPPDPSLLALFNARFNLSSTGPVTLPPTTRVLESAQYITDNSIDVAISMSGTKSAATTIYEAMQRKEFNLKSWSEDHELHPRVGEFGVVEEDWKSKESKESEEGEEREDQSLTEGKGEEVNEGGGNGKGKGDRERDGKEAVVRFIFVMDLLNFSFWSGQGVQDEEKKEKSEEMAGEVCKEEVRFQVEYRGRMWTGYWSLVASLRRAVDEGIPITDPAYWTSEECTDERIAHVFRSATEEQIPMLEERIACLREAGQILQEDFAGSFLTCVEESNESAAALVNLLKSNFPCFRDEATFEGKPVRFYKRSQILVADLWACFQGEGYGKFNDIDTLTMFADYRIPQILYTMGCLTYSPPLESRIRELKVIESGHSWELQLRGCSIWAVELIRREILREHPNETVNAVLIDFFLYDTIKEQEAKGVESIPHHRTRSIWY